MAKESFEKLKELVNDDYVNNNIRMNNYRDAVDQKLHEVTFEYFPELFESNPEIIKRYKSELIDATLNFTSRIDKLLHGKL